MIEPATVMLLVSVTASGGNREGSGWLVMLEEAV